MPVGHVVEFESLLGTEPNVTETEQNAEPALVYGLPWCHRPG